MLKARRERIKAGKPLFTSHLDETEAAEVTLQIIFFDGEEAFHQWTDADSVYGSRHLAETWEDTLLPTTHPLAAKRIDRLPNMLDTIDVLVLLDLLGAPKPRMSSFYPETQWLFFEMAVVDKKLQKAGLVEAADNDKKWFNDAPGRPGAVDDDHRPFLQRGVPILHLIPLPFPKVWHKMSVSRTEP
jgi:hypothetical protein